MWNDSTSKIILPHVFKNSLSTQEWVDVKYISLYTCEMIQILDGYVVNETVSNIVE